MWKTAPKRKSPESAVTSSTWRVPQPFSSMPCYALASLQHLQSDSSSCRPLKGGDFTMAMRCDARCDPLP